MNGEIERITNLLKERHEQTVFHALGLRIVELDPERTRMSLLIDDRHRQHAGLVHGGIYALLAESAASLAATVYLNDEQKRAVGIEINASHLRAKQSGELYAETRRLHGGSRTMVYEVAIYDEDKNMVSICRCSLLVVHKINSAVDK